MEQMNECIQPEGHAGRIVTLEQTGEEWFAIEAVAERHILLKNLQSGMLLMQEIENVNLYLVKPEQLSRRFGCKTLRHG